ncbi:hypothetical protein DRN67_00525 [Candidatus Micrarchaeota archaeon]|nr:MAG: hypothetical protein DRN67_00525 [Candidatus Micrarchaeota archaeon]
MKTAFSALLIAVLLLSGCANQAHTPTPPDETVGEPEVVEEDETGSYQDEEKFDDEEGDEMLMPGLEGAEVYVEVDKQEYGENEVVRITVSNRGDEAVYYLKGCGASYNLQYESEAGIVEKYVDGFQCPVDHVYEFTAIRPGESTNFEWDQNAYHTVPYYTYYGIMPGTYKIKFTYKAGEEFEGKTLTLDNFEDVVEFYSMSVAGGEAFSDEFEITTPATEPQVEPPNEKGVLVYTDKSEYGEGETVRITVMNNLNREEPVYYLYGCIDLYGVYKLEGEGFEARSLGHIYCLANPTIESLEYGEQIVLEWNQKIEVEVEESSFGPYYDYVREPGIYKIGFRFYSDQNAQNEEWAYSEEIELVESISEVES